MKLEWEYMLYCMCNVLVHATRKFATKLEEEVGGAQEYCSGSGNDKTRHASAMVHVPSTWGCWRGDDGLWIVILFLSVCYICLFVCYGWSAKFKVVGSIRWDKDKGHKATSHHRFTQPSAQCPVPGAHPYFTQNIFGYQLL